MNNEFFLTEVAKDWSAHNLAVIQDVIRQANTATLARTDVIADPLLDTPNIANVRGVVRWAMVQKHLELAAKAGRFTGITPHWVDLGGAHSFELRGRYTSVAPCHLLDPNDVPRESTHRKSHRVINQVSPVLKGWEDLEEPAPDDALFHLLLVHGGRDSEFAYLRAYVDPQDPAIYRELSKNIMKMPVLVPSIDFEPVAEPQVDLNQSAKKKVVGDDL